MITKLGKELRKIRLDEGITLHDMATAIEVSSSLLSSVETGKRSATGELIERLSAAYHAINVRKAEFDRLAEETKSEVKIKLNAENQKANDVALAFARNFNSLSSDQLDHLMAVFTNKDKEDR